jgi:hypothetical protein
MDHPKLWIGKVIGNRGWDVGLGASREGNQRGENPMWKV